MGAILKWAAENPKVVAVLLAVLAALLKGGITWAFVLKQASRLISEAGKEVSPGLTSLQGAKLDVAAQIVENIGGKALKRTIAQRAADAGPLVQMAITSVAAVADQKPEKKPVNKAKQFVGAILGGMLTKLVLKKM